MAEITFDLGKNIVDTARDSGVPEYLTQEADGLIFYEVIDIPNGISVKFEKEGYKLNIQEPYAFTLNADRKKSTDLIVNRASIMVRHGAFKTHQDAKFYIENLIDQFQRGQWERYIPNTCPRITGRSSILDISGNLVSRLTCPDPAYKLSSEEWEKSAEKGFSYQWVGDGIHARVHLRGAHQKTLGMWYDVTIEFEDLAVREKRLADSLARDLKTGDEKGWNATAEYEAELIEREKRHRLLEANALKRGDRIVPPPTD